MTMLTIELPTDNYERLRTLAAQQGKPVEVFAQELLVEHSTVPRTDLPPPAPPGERERMRKILQDAGMLTELTTEEKIQAAQSTLTLAEARAILDRVPNMPLSELVLEMRGPKV